MFVRTQSQLSMYNGSKNGKIRAHESNIFKICKTNWIKTHHFIYFK